MRVLTMNIYGRHGAWQDRRSVLIAGLAELSPDVVVFQESVQTAEYDQVTDVLGPGYQVFHQAGRSEQGVGASIASRWPFEVVAEADLNVDASGDATGWIGSLVVDIRVPDPIGPMLLAHHKPTWQSHLEVVRERQAVKAAQVIEQVVSGPDRHVLLAGDFDATPDAASVRFWAGRQSLDSLSVYYQDAWEAIHRDEPGHTFTPRNRLVSSHWRPRPGRRIDYIFVRCGAKGAELNVTACELALAEPVGGIWASDHFGVVADLAAKGSHEPGEERSHSS